MRLPPSRISVSPNCGPSVARHSRGMTIIEIAIVLAILVLMVGMVLVGFSTSRAAEVMRGVNQVANTMRYGYDKARVDGAYYRLLIDIDSRTFTLQAGDGKMYLPATDRDGEILEYDAAKEEERDDRDRRAEEQYNRSLQAEIFDRDDNADEEEVGDVDVYKARAKKVPRRRPPLFEGFESENALSGLSKPIKLPEDVNITYVRTDADVKPITEGQGSIYFFPRGRTQKAHIQIEDSDSDAQWTIKLEPLTGRVTIVDGFEDLVLPKEVDEDEDELGNKRTRRTF